jgi:UDP-2-acetamido-2,6-beta-L-arabino-hexul-4-ose reductase
VNAFVAEANQSHAGVSFGNVRDLQQIALGDLADTLLSFHESRDTLKMPAFSSVFQRDLYATFLSYLPKDRFSYPLQKRVDERGVLAEFIKADTFGQIFVSRTKPGITRGNHYHHTKTEKFLVLEGDAIIRFRHLLNNEVTEYPVSGSEMRVVDIPPGYTHSIENVGVSDMVVLFWASEVFDPAVPDTHFEEVFECGKDLDESRNHRRHAA